MTYRLVTPRDALAELSNMFAGAQSAKIQVWDSACFPVGNSLDLGTLEIFPRSGTLDDAAVALARGAYEWRTPPAEATGAAIVALVTKKNGGDSKAAEAVAATDKARRVLDSIASIPMRAGLTYPRFDAGALERMPFRQQTTLVADTSGVVQGGLDFIAAFMQPTTRIKVPAIVHMEIVNQAENYFKRRRSTKPAQVGSLIDHLLSQGGQRTLMRLEMRSDTEVERTPLVGDPLRNAFLADKESGASELNLSVPLRSYCDRLIVEAARQHQAYMNPGHPLMLLTSDQGLARMALAEGIAPLFFESVKAADFFDRHISGVGFNPLTGELTYVTLTSVLWEIATAFGSASITSEDGKRSIEIAALGEGLSWSPFHSRDDLLWLRDSGDDVKHSRNSGAPPATPAAKAAALGEIPAEAKAAKKPAPKKAASPKADTKKADDGSSYYRVTAQSLLDVVLNISSSGAIAEGDVQPLIKLKNPRSILEYKRFLIAGGFIRVEGEQWIAEPAVDQLAAAAMSLDGHAVGESLQRVPSFAAFVQRVRQLRRLPDLRESEIPERAVSTYRSLAELGLLGALVAGDAWYATVSNPAPPEFARIAAARYDELAVGEQWVSVGAWLEALIQKDSIHPVDARARLNEAAAAGLVNRVTEGSTTDTRHDGHSIDMLELVDGRLKVTTAYLYRGDFLIPGKSSSSLMIKQSDA